MRSLVSRNIEEIAGLEVEGVDRIKWDWRKSARGDTQLPFVSALHANRNRTGSSLIYSSQIDAFSDFSYQEKSSTTFEVMTANRLDGHRNRTKGGLRFKVCLRLGVKSSPRRIDRTKSMGQCHKSLTNGGKVCQQKNFS
jgi:hypothetical protein